MTKYSLKKASCKDYDFLKDVHHVTLKEHISKIWGWNESNQDDFFEEEFASGQIQIIKFSQADVGYLILHEDTNLVYIVQLLILPEYQNRGLGSQILRDLIEKTKKIASL
ncbi:MAG: hypothetical protein COT73_06175 [Bdellovibrio sp. CG10_big_fil_rev_8_21_14_0_10_47_8]|nr:MAG: hypothetical protein COT73_06175 [Bdellovibrio sp. CG10_big_fil_rev_8_21_14_0_10_47_8]